MKIIIPGLELNDVLNLEKNLPDLGSAEEVILDFSAVSRIEPLPMLMAGSVIRRYRSRYPRNSFCIRNGKKHTYAGTMGFFKYINQNINVGKEPGEASGNCNYIPITRISLRDLQKKALSTNGDITIGGILENEAERLSTIVDRGNKELHALLTYLLREILRNTPEHAGVDNMWICGQYWPSNHMAEISIIDEGIGIYKSLTKNKTHAKYIKDNSSALQWALKAGISQAFNPAGRRHSNMYDVWENSGYGLYMVSEICRNLNGSFQLISYDSALSIDNNDPVIQSASFQGTAIRIRIPTVGIKSAQEIIERIAGQGMVEAKTIETAFKEASMPSRGLMNKLSIR